MSNLCLSKVSSTKVLGYQSCFLFWICSTNSSFRLDLFRHFLFKHCFFLVFRSICHLFFTVFGSLSLSRIEIFSKDALSSFSFKEQLIATYVGKNNWKHFGQKSCAIVCFEPYKTTDDAGRGASLD